LVTRNQTGNGSADGLEAGKYNIEWKLECGKRIMYRRRMPKLNQVNSLIKTMQETIARCKLPDVTCKLPEPEYKPELKPRT
jgi:hypothetical protein